MKSGRHTLAIRFPGSDDRIIGTKECTNGVHVALIRHVSADACSVILSHLIGKMEREAKRADLLIRLHLRGCTAL